MKRQIIYIEDNGTVICTNVCEKEVVVKSLVLDYEQDKDKFSKAIKYHVKDGVVIFDEFIDISKENIDKLKEENEKLQKELLITQKKLVEKEMKMIGKEVE